MYNPSAYSEIKKYYFKKCLLFFTVYKNEQKEYKFWWQKNKKSDFYENKKINKIDDTDVNNNISF